VPTLGSNSIIVSGLMMMPSQPALPQVNDAFYRGEAFQISDGVYRGEPVVIQLVQAGGGTDNAALGLAPGTRLPSRDAADWSGAIGNSNFTPRRPQDFGLRSGQVLPYRNGRPDFEQFAIEVPGTRPGTTVQTFTVPDLGTGPNAQSSPDRQAMLRALATRRGETIAQTEQWLQEHNYRLHHAGGLRAQVVPAGIHDAVPHTGGRSDNARMGIGSSSTGRTTRPTVRARAFGALGVYLTLRDACEGLGIIRPEGNVINADYYFQAIDGSVFVVEEPGDLNFWSNPRRVYVAGPRAGQTEVITQTQARFYRYQAEALYGRVNPGGLFWFQRGRTFTPGTLRSRLPIYDERWRQIGYIDENGEHYYPESQIERPVG
jgi:hypothetical protein